MQAFFAWNGQFLQCDKTGVKLRRIQLKRHCDRHIKANNKVLNSISTLTELIPRGWEVERLWINLKW